MDGMREGFELASLETLGACCNALYKICLAPTRDQPEVIDSYLAEECSRDRVLGPLSQDPFPQVHPNRFSVIPKGTSASGKWRLIVDMSLRTDR